MRRKMTAGAVAVILLVTLTSSPIAWASPDHKDLGAASWWKGWLEELSVAFQGGWWRLLDRSSEEEEDEAERVGPEVLLESGGTCEGPLVTKHGCTADPNG